MSAGADRPALLGGAPCYPDGLRLVRPWTGPTGPLVERMRSVLDSGTLTNGPTVRELEATVAARCDVPHVVAVSSATAGLMLVFQALVEGGRRVVMPSFTFAAGPHAVLWAGGSPVWAEVEASRLTLDVDDAAAVADGAAALSATHTYGHPGDVDRLEALGGELGVPVVYDAAHGLGSAHAGRPIGSFGTAEVFSLSPTKVVVGVEGGIVTTHDSELAERVRIGRDYGNPGTYDCEFAGINARMSELHAAVALSSLEGLDDRVAARTRVADRVAAVLADVPGVRVVRPAPGDVSTYKDLSLVLDPDAFGLDVAESVAALRAEGIETRRYFHPPVHRQKAYRHLAGDRDLPVTDRVSATVLTLPLWSSMTENDGDLLATSVARLQPHAAAVRATLA